MQSYITPECFSLSDFKEIYRSMRLNWGMKEYLIYMINHTFENGFMKFMRHQKDIETESDILRKIGLCAITASYNQMHSLISNELKRPKSVQDFRRTLCFTIRYFLNLGYHVHCSYEESENETASFRMIVSPLDLSERKNESTTLAMAAAIPEITVSAKDQMKMTEEISAQLLKNMKVNENLDTVPYENDERVNQQEYRERLKTPGEEPEF